MPLLAIVPACNASLMQAYVFCLLARCFVVGAWGPAKFAEVVGFGRIDPTRTSDLVRWSPDGGSGRPVGKGECRGNPKGKLIGVSFLLLTFLWTSKDKVTRRRRNNTLNYTILFLRQGQKNYASITLDSCIRHLNKFCSAAAIYRNTSNPIQPDYRFIARYRRRSSGRSTSQHSDSNP